MLRYGNAGRFCTGREPNWIRGDRGDDLHANPAVSTAHTVWGRDPQQENDEVSAFADRRSTRAAVTTPSSARRPGVRSNYREQPPRVGGGTVWNFKILSRSGVGDGP